MQHDPTLDKKRKIETADSCISSETLETIPTSVFPQENLMFLQIIDVYPRYYFVNIDPVENRIIYEDLLEFERSKITIQMNNYQPQTLYCLYEGKVCHPERYTAWLDFFRKNFTGENLDKYELFTLNRESSPKVTKARWFVCYKEY